MAVFALPESLFAFYRPHIEYLTRQATKPDERRGAFPGEAPRHYIDLDRYPADLPRRWSEAEALLGRDTLHAHGILPWHLETSFWELVEAFRAKQVTRILKLSAEIGHYLADAHVPLHTTANYNGQLTGQQGVHGLWESLIPERYGEGYDYWVGKARLWRRTQDTLWAIIYESHALVERVLAAEREATLRVGEEKKFVYRSRGRQTVRTYSEDFLTVYHALLEGMVESRLRRAVQRLASFWYTAWHVAGRPALGGSEPLELEVDPLPDSLAADPRCGEVGHNRELSVPLLYWASLPRLPLRMRCVWVTGGAGFIGSHLVRHLVREKPSWQIHTLDALTYAGNLSNLTDVLSAPSHRFHRIDIADPSAVETLWQQHPPDLILHLAAESHVDRSILSPQDFVHTNVVGTVTLLEAARRHWKDRKDVLFYQVSTDEVYGSLSEGGFFTESSAYDPRSPYSASKAAADHFVRAYGHTYGLPYMISNCGNNYGPYQFPEKLIPLTITHLMERKPIPVYGEGKNVRDWIYVEDHVRAIALLAEKGRIGHTYLIGARNPRPNLEVVSLLCDLYDELTGSQNSRSLITFVKDRPGHDFRYAIEPSPGLEGLGWRPAVSFVEGLRHTIQWYLQNNAWLEAVRSGEYQAYYARQYGERLT